MHVSRLRRKLGGEALRILTMRGVGYMLAVAEAVEDDGAAARGAAGPAAAAGG